MATTNLKIKVGLGTALLVAVIGWQVKKAMEPRLPAWIASGNGRLEAQEVDIASKYQGRIKELRVEEGDPVAPGEVLALMDTAEIEATLAETRANLAKAEAAVSQSEALVRQEESHLSLASLDLRRAVPLRNKGALSQRTSDQRQSAQEVANANLQAAKDNQRALVRAVQAARADVAKVQAERNDYTLNCPVKGRVLYRLAQPGELLGAGGKALTVIDMGKVYMEVFLPAPQASRVMIGAEARILFDDAPGEPVPAKVTFVSPEAQYTPKQVETASEREKLMFRVKVELPHAYVTTHFQALKIGLRGMAYFRLDPGQAWPKSLQPQSPVAE